MNRDIVEKELKALGATEVEFLERENFAETTVDVSAWIDDWVRTARFPKDEADEEVVKNLKIHVSAERQRRRTPT